MKFSNLITLVILLNSCTKIGDQNNLSNVRALQPFTAVVIERAPGKAIIQWTAAQNLNSRDTVKYNLMLQGKNYQNGPA
jgi:hypothetical protein